MLLALMLKLRWMRFEVSNQIHKYFGFYCAALYQCLPNKTNSIRTRACGSIRVHNNFIFNCIYTKSDGGPLALRKIMWKATVVHVNSHAVPLLIGKIAFVYSDYLVLFLPSFMDKQNIAACDTTSFLWGERKIWDNT